jgi:hypothetical protein
MRVKVKDQDDVCVCVCVQMFDDENEKEYVYKEPHATQLNQVCERLSHMYTIKFGKGSVELIRDSNKVCSRSELHVNWMIVQLRYISYLLLACC